MDDLKNKWNDRKKQHSKSDKPKYKNVNKDSVENTPEGARGPWRGGPRHDGGGHNGGQQSGGNAKKFSSGNQSNQFDQYLPPAEIQRGLQTGQMVEGILRINPKNYEDGYICSGDSGHDIMIKGIKNRCRALNGDLVVVRLDPAWEWNVNHSAVQDYLDRCGTDEERSLLMQECVVNVKQEKDCAMTMMDKDMKVQTMTDRDMTVQMDISLDTYRPPVRGPDTLALASHCSVGETDKVKVDVGGWGSGEVSGAKWEVGPEVEDTFAKAMLEEVMNGEVKKRGRSGVEVRTQIGEVRGVGTVSARMEEMAVDLKSEDRVPVVRETNLVDPVNLVCDAPREEVKFKEDFSNSQPVIVDVDDVLEVEESDYESDHSTSVLDDIDRKLEDEAFRLANLNLGENTIKAVEAKVDVINIDSDDDVIVETVEGVPPEMKSSKKTRRGRRGGGGSKGGGGGGVESVKITESVPVSKMPTNKAVNLSLNTSLDTTTDSCMSQKSNSSSRYARKQPSKPLVEYNVLAVLKHKDHLKLHFVQRTGKVVAIRELKHSRKAAGTIKPMTDPKSKFFLFSPTDSKIPRMRIPMVEAPNGFTTRPQDAEGIMFVARIVKWDLVNYAIGTLEGSLGKNSDIKVRTEGLLIENNIDYSEFGHDVLNDLPQNHESWSIPPQELKRRRDFRKDCVFTIDPLTARDLDDALSVSLESNGLYRVGVHIADVSYFVREKTALDNVASDRATSTYLVDQVIPMLPRPLCENLCSLNPDEDRLCFSVEWTINDKAEILSEWFGRTVIRSCTKLAYEHAQSMIDEPSKVWENDTGSLPPISGGYTAATISAKVNMLQKLAVLLRERRQQAGALRLDQPKLCFSLNKETGLPDGFKLHEHRHSNKLIEEFMLLANMAVAHKIYKSFPELAVLRRHPPPKAAMMETVVQQLATIGIDLDSSSSQSLARSLERLKDSLGCGDKDEVAAKLACVTSLCSKPMELARYFCTGMFDVQDFHHFALNVPLYTHFTSPIRRYPDILVHRVLDAAITGRSLTWRCDQVQLQTEHCNDQRLAAKRVGEASAELFLGLFVAECGPISQPATVIQVMDHSLDVLILEMGVVKRVYVDRLGVSSYRFRRVNGINYLDLVWGEGSPSKVSKTLSLLSRVTVTLEKGERPFDFRAVIDSPLEETIENPQVEVVTLD